MQSSDDPHSIAIVPSGDDGPDTSDPEPSNAYTENDATRLEQRFQFITELTLQLSEDRTIQGYTTDVSLSGTFLELEAHTLERHVFKVGETGVAAVTLHKGTQVYNMAFPCVIARVTPHGLGLHFDLDEGMEEEADGWEEEGEEGHMMNDTETWNGLLMDDTEDAFGEEDG